MNRSLARWRIAATAATALALGSCGSDAGSGDVAVGDRAPPYVQAHTIQQFMADVVQPTADMYWQSVQYISDEEGEHDIRPQTDEEWLVTRTAAANLIAQGNLLMTPLYTEGRGADWMDFARGLAEMGIRAEQAAIDRDADAVFETGGNVYNVCRGCHQLYPPAEGAPGITSGGTLRPTGDLSLEEYQDQAAQ